MILSTVYIYVFYVRTLHPHSLLFFFNDTATTEIYTLSLHDALPISGLRRRADRVVRERSERDRQEVPRQPHADRKSTRLNSSHVEISYAVFCLKKKKKKIDNNKVLQPQEYTYRSYVYLLAAAEKGYV